MNKFNAYFTYIIILLVFSGIITVGLYLSLMLLPIIILGALALGAISWFLNYKAAKQTKIIYKTYKQEKSSPEIIDAEYEILDKDK